MSRHQSDAPTTVLEMWGIRPGLRIWVGGHNLQAKTEIEEYLPGTERPPTGPVDLGVIGPQAPDEALYFAGKLRARLVAGGLVWIVYPNPRSGDEFASSLDELIVGMFERGFGEAGRGMVSERYSTIGFRIEQALEDF